MLMRPPSSPCIAMRKPCPSSPSRCAAGTRTPSNAMARVGWLFHPIFFLAAVLDPRRIAFHQERGDAIRARTTGARHHHQHVGRAGAGDEGLVAVDHVGIAIAARGRAQRRRVGARARFGQAVRRELHAAAQRGTESTRDRFRRIRAHHPRRHVVDAEEGRRRGAGGGQFLQHDRRVQPRQPESRWPPAHTTRRSRVRPHGAACRAGRTTARPSRPHAVPSRRGRSRAPPAGRRVAARRARSPSGAHRLT